MIQWLDEFYGDPELRSTLLESFLPVFSNYVSEAVGTDVAADFVLSLAESYVDRHLGSSRAQLQEVIKGADDPLVALAQRFDEWEEKRPEKVARNELVRSANAAQVQQFREAGVTKMVWRASGGDTCPFCTELDGVIISVDGTFFEKGDELNPEGATAPIHFESSLGHPPVHQGCVCSVEAVMETEVAPMEAAEAQDRLFDLVEADAPDMWEIPGETRAEIVNGFERVHARYPRAFANWRGSVRLVDGAPNEVASNGVGKYNGQPGGIYTLSLNRAKWTDRETIVQQMRSDEAHGWAAKGANTPESAIVHELGHLIDGDSGHAGSKLVESFPGVSQYGATDSGERFAEAVRAVFYTPEAEWTDEVRAVAAFLEDYK